jgi:prepilin-type N-terminal cleavage/methylation domain-containing protein
MMLRDQRGFTVAEVLVAAVIVSIAFVALGRVVPVANYAVREGAQLSTATFLADQKMEQIKGLPWVGTPANDCLGVSAPINLSPRVPTGASCTLGVTTVAANQALPWEADEIAPAISGFGDYSRRVRVTDCGTGVGCMGIVDPGIRLVTVTISYKPMTARGTAANIKSYTISMLVSQR